jgi:hypothetical protein
MLCLLVGSASLESSYSLLPNTFFVKLFCLSPPPPAFEVRKLKMPSPSGLKLEPELRIILGNREFYLFASLFGELLLNL